ncbi:MAG: hypothetical protein HY866_01135 [Chloroflexi bacterium]|nr:hypothetical protein [Chloroflexota bacterium]
MLLQLGCLLLIFVAFPALIFIWVAKSVEQNILRDRSTFARAIIVFGPVILFWFIIAKIMLLRQDQCPPGAGTADPCEDMFFQCTGPVLGIAALVCAYSIGYLAWKGLLALMPYLLGDVEKRP